MSLTKQEIEKRLAEKCGLTPNKVCDVLDELARLGCQEAHNGFIIPGDNYF